MEREASLLATVAVQITKVLACVHTLWLHGMLSAYIDCYKKQKKIPNMSALAKTGMPTGRGRKGVKPPRKRRRGGSTETRVPFNPTAEENTDLPQTCGVLSTPAAVLSGCSNQGSPLGSAPQGYASCHVVTVGAQLGASMPPSAPPPVHPSAACPRAGFGPPPLIPCHNVGTVYNMLAPQVPSPGSGVSSRSFNLHFICGNISRCAGCKGKYCFCT